MSKVTMLAEFSDGSFSRLSLNVTPLGLEHTRNRQLYDNFEHATFPVSAPFQLDTYEELISCPPVPMEQVPERWMMLGEYDGHYPYSPYPVLTQDHFNTRKERTSKLYYYGFNSAAAQNAKRSLENPFLSTAMFVLFGIIGVFAIIAAIALAFAIFNNQHAAGIMPAVMFGAIAATRAKRKKRIHDWSVYVIAVKDRLIRHYSLPFREIYANVHEENWRYPALRKFKWIGAAIGFCTPIIVAAMLMVNLPYYIFFEGLGAILLLLPCSIIGYKLAPAVMRELFWWCRPYVKFYLNPENQLVPVRYTDAIGVDPGVWKKLYDDALAKEQAACDENDEEIPDRIEWPIPPRASEAWESAYSPLHRHFLNRVPLTLSQKLQIVSMFLVAAGVMALGFFIVMATQ